MHSLTYYTVYGFVTGTRKKGRKKKMKEKNVILQKINKTRVICDVRKEQTFISSLWAQIKGLLW
jgi:hypothetical protein